MPRISVLSHGELPLVLHSGLSLDLTSSKKPLPCHPLPVTQGKYYLVLVSFSPHFYHRTHHSHVVIPCFAVFSLYSVFLKDRGLELIPTVSDMY